MFCIIKHDSITTQAYDMWYTTYQDRIYLTEMENVVVYRLDEYSLSLSIINIVIMPVSHKHKLVQGWNVT